MAEERACKLCGERIRIIVNEHGDPFAIDAKTIPVPILSASGERVVRYMHFNLAHAMTCTVDRAQRAAAGGAAAASKTSPTPSPIKPKSQKGGT